VYSARVISPDLLEILACPACDSRPKVNLENDRLVCVECGRRYPIRDGIPVMLVEDAENARPGGASASAPAASPPKSGTP
jgi:uncharacterized protein